MNKNRFKNPWFWIGLIGIMATAVGADVKEFNSWESVGEEITEVISNPYMLGCMVAAVLGVFVDPTTKGIKDGEQWK